MHLQLLEEIIKKENSVLLTVMEPIGQELNSYPHNRKIVEINIIFYNNFLIVSKVVSPESSKLM